MWQDFAPLDRASIPAGAGLVSIRKLEFIVGMLFLAGREPLTRRFAPPSPAGRGRSQTATRIYESTSDPQDRRVVDRGRILVDRRLLIATITIGVLPAALTSKERKMTWTNQILLVFTPVLGLNALSPRERVREAGVRGPLSSYRKLIWTGVVWGTPAGCRYGSRA